MKKEKYKQNEYVRVFGKRAIDVELSLVDKTKLFLFNKKYKDFNLAYKSDVFMKTNGEKGIKNEGYEKVLFIENIIGMVDSITKEYEVFSQDKTKSFLKVVFNKYNSRFNRDEFDIVLNKKRNITDIKHLEDIINEEVNDKDKYKFTIIVKADIKKMYIKYEDKPMFISNNELHKISLNNNVFLGIDEKDNSKYVELYGDNNIHTFIIGATGSGKTTFLNTIIKQLEFKKNFEDTLEEKQIYNGKKIKKIDIWKGKIEYEIWDNVKGGDFEKVNVKDTKKLILRIEELAKYISSVNKGEIKPTSRKVIIWDEFMSSISRISLEVANEDKMLIIKTLINSILREARSAGVHFIFASQRISESDEMAGLQVLSNINLFISLKTSGGTTNYIRNILKFFKDKYINTLKKGELWYIDYNGEETFTNWLMYNEECLNEETIEEHIKEVEETQKPMDNHYFENISNEYKN